MAQYWVVGAMWGGHDDQSDVFLLRGYWYLGWKDKEQPDQAALRNQIQGGDRIAIKRMLGQGSTNIEIRAIGIVKDVDEDKVIYVDWILRDMERVVPSRGCFQSIHGPFDPEDEWTNMVFRL